MERKHLVKHLWNLEYLKQHFVNIPMAVEISPLAGLQLHQMLKKHVTEKFSFDEHTCQT